MESKTNEALKCKGKSRSKGKMTSLNFNLKNEIFTFLPLEQLVRKVMISDKKIFHALKSNKIFKFIVQNSGNLLSEADFFHPEIERIKKLFPFITENLPSEAEFNDFIAYVLNLKLKDEEILNLPFDTFNIKILGMFIKTNKRIKTLNLSDLNLTQAEPSFRAICEAMQFNTGIEELFLSSNAIGKRSSDMLHLQKMLKGNKTLKILHLSENSIGCIYTEDLKHLAEGLSHNSTLEEIYLSSNAFGERDFNQESIGLGLERGQSGLKIISLSNTGIGSFPKHSEILGKVFSKNKNLEIFYLNDNQLGTTSARDAEFIFGALENNFTLKKLHLYGNSFGTNDSDIDRLSKMINGNKTLKYLEINENEFKEKDFDILNKLDLNQIRILL